MYKYFNPNPLGKSVDDGIIRALCKATDKRWDDVLLDLFISAYNLADVPTSKEVWGDYLKSNNFKQFLAPEKISIKEFAKINNGEYVIVTDTHAVYALDGDYYDEYDSGTEEVSYYFRRDYV